MLLCTCVKVQDKVNTILKAVPQPTGDSSGPTRRGTCERPPTLVSGLSGAILNYLKQKANALFAGECRNEIVNSVHSLKVCLVDFHINFFFMVLLKLI